MQEIFVKGFRLMSNEEPDITEGFKQFLSKMSGPTKTQLIVLTKGLKLDVWEDFLFGNLPNIREEKDPAEVILVKRKETNIPYSFYSESKVIRTTNSYTWESHTRNKMKFQFPPTWRFPKWIRSSYKIDLTFDSFSANKLDSLLAEYAGVIDRGQIRYTYEDGHRIQQEGFKLDPTSPICQNILCYLRMLYGGESGLSKQIELWLEALEARNQDLPSKLGRRSADFVHPEIQIWDSVFMGGCTDRNFANLNSLNQVVIHKGKSYRRYHEGSPRSKAKKIRIDTDPSDMPTCQDVTQRADKVRRKGGTSKKNLNIFNASVPEGISYFEVEDFTPTLEHLPLIVNQLKSRYGETWFNDCLKIFNKEAGYYALVPNNPQTNCSYNECTPGFIPAYEWEPHWDPISKQNVPGSKDLVDDPSIWEYYPAQTVLVWKDPEGISHKLVFPGSTQRDVGPLSKDLHKNIDPTNVFELNRTRVWSAKKEAWVLPYSFTVKNQDGKEKKVTVSPKPVTFNKAEWNIIRRSMSQLESIRKLLHEERWEYLAFTELNNCLEDEFDEDNSEISMEEEAIERIKSKLEELKDVFLTTINTKPEKIVGEIEDLLQNLPNFVFGNREYEKVISNTDTCSEPAKRKLSCKDSFDRSLKNSELSYIQNLKKLRNENNKDNIDRLIQRSWNRIKGESNVLVKPVKKKKKKNWAYYQWLIYQASPGNTKYKKLLKLYIKRYEPKKI